MAATRNRRSAKSSAPKGNEPTKRQRNSNARKSLGEPFGDNTVVQRRLALIPRPDLKKAAKEFSEGQPINALVEKYGFKRTAHATYAIRQQLVQDGTVPTVQPTKEALTKAQQADEYSDLPWLAARSGLNHERIKKLIAS